MEDPAGFERGRDGADEWLIRSDLRDLVRPQLDRWLGAETPASGVTMEGGRGGAFRVTLSGIVAVVRPYRRGGLPGRFVRETYLSLARSPRPFQELRVTADLRVRGVSVPEPFAAAVRWRGCGRYRGVFASAWIDGSMSLWELLRQRPAGGVRLAALRASAGVIARLHRVGAAHPDLNLNNILVRESAAWLIDFDHGRLRATPDAQRRSLARLRRSARKLDPSGAFVTDADLAVLCRASNAEP